MIQRENALPVRIQVNPLVTSASIRACSCHEETGARGFCGEYFFIFEEANAFRMLPDFQNKKAFFSLNTSASIRFRFPLNFATEPTHANWRMMMGAEHEYSVSSLFTLLAFPPQLATFCYYSFTRISRTVVVVVVVSPPRPPREEL